MSLRELLKDKLQEEKLLLLPKGFEVIGDIAIINLPSPLYDKKHLIAQALVSHSKKVKVVLLKNNKLAGEKRIAEFEILLGDRTTTLHRENGCVFHVDIAKTYFSGKMYFERDRIVDNNPAACSLFRKNAWLNNIDAEIVLGDANSMGALFKKDFEIQHFRRLLEKMGWHIEFFRDCGDVAPRVSRYVFDLKCSS